jgi:hypothetical protein
MIYAILRPTPSHGWQMSLMCFFHPRLVSLRDILLVIVAVTSRLMSQLPPMLGTQLRRVRVLHVKTTQVTHIPIVVHLDNIGHR